MILKKKTHESTESKLCGHENKDLVYTGIPGHTPKSNKKKKNKKHSYSSPTEKLQVSRGTVFVNEQRVKEKNELIKQ